MFIENGKSGQPRKVSQTGWGLEPVPDGYDHGADKVSLECLSPYSRLCVLHHRCKHLPSSFSEGQSHFMLFITKEKTKDRERKWDGVGVMKDKNLKLEDVEVPHTLGGVSHILFEHIDPLRVGVVGIFVPVKKIEKTCSLHSFIKMCIKSLEK